MVGDTMTPAQLARQIAVALGEEPADVVIRAGRVFDLVTGELRRADVAIAGERIVGLGEGYEAREFIDAEGRTLVPGFVDAHCHIESSLVAPYAWEEAVLMRGTVAAVCDPHELANVCGSAAIDFFRSAAEGMVMHLQVQASSCVPALPSEEAGARLGAEALAPYAAAGLSLAEMMNVPGVLERDPEVLAKLAAFSGRPIDGHAPCLSGRALDGYLAAGISNDHECSTVDEALEKLRRGMTLFLRAGSVGQDLARLAPLLTLTHCDHLCLCTDDRDPLDIREHGHLDAAIRQAIALGCDPLAVYRAASLSPARHFGWRRRGLVAPGYAADIVLVSDLAECRVAGVLCRGRIVDPERFEQRPPCPVPEAFHGSIKMRTVSAADFAPPEPGPAIGVREGSLLTDAVDWSAAQASGDLAVAALIERHGGSGRIGRAWVTGFGLKRGALASTVGHDSHNLCVVGTNPEEMALAANAVRDCGGGFAVVLGERVAASLPLTVGGLMSERPATEVADALAELRAAAQKTGTVLQNPFLSLAFLPLPVIPAARLTLGGFQAL